MASTKSCRRTRSERRTVRAKLLNDDLGNKARARVAAREIAAFEGQRDDNHAMSPLLKRG